MSTFFGKKSQAKKKDDFTFTLNDIDVAKIDKDFNMNEMRNIETHDIVFDTDDNKTSLKKLGISSLRHEPITTIIPKEKTKLHTFITMTDLASKKEMPQSTNIPCFNCRRHFTTCPLGIPIEYHPSVYKSKNDPSKIKKLTINERQKLEVDKTNDIEVLEYFDTDGIVCSFNCIVGFIDDNPSPLYKKTPSLIPKMYRMIFGKYPTEAIIKSPSWRLREEYGGVLSDEEFVANLQTLVFTDLNQIQKVLRRMKQVGRLFKVTEVETR